MKLKSFKDIVDISFNHLFIYMYSYTRSFVRSFVRSLVQTFKEQTNCYEHLKKNEHLKITYMPRDYYQYNINLHEKNKLKNGRNKNELL